MDTDPCKFLPPNVRHKVLGDLATLGAASVDAAEAATGATVPTPDDSQAAPAMAEAPPDALARAASISSAADLGAGALVVLSPSGDVRHLASWAQRYLAAEVVGVQSLNTLDAKTRDLSGFIRWFMEVNGHGMAAQWMPRDTQEYLGRYCQLELTDSLYPCQ